ncbi:family 43 glycosylhydrolase [Hufsiella ginkgonis]|uniref:Family 43 glycosylhydrolase n=1 Tax=Hufsiella ginkgonis TaxID=2695274 RepID=A0A7K1Y3G9_9SPHI|nr:family 43 glycosylhydrolase [Hufsiella ginkgonis]MXV17825.1 family 43 glycosylhydrolase [Hufsiella ginkgonis]
MKNPLLCLVALLLSFSIDNVLGQEKLPAYFNPFVPDHLADPSVAVFNGTYYLYATTDINHGLAEMGPPVAWKSKDFVNWSFEGTLIPSINWNKPYEFTDDKGAKRTGYFRYWAPGKPIKRKGKYYLFPTIVTPDEKMGTYVMLADKPEGPFRFAEGAGLYFNDGPHPDASKPLAPDIDGEVFVDDDGSSYIVWRRRNASKLNDDWRSLTGEPVQIPTKYGGYSEGPILFKREGIYYYVYTLSGNANYCNGYMISRKGPLGPYEAPPGPGIFISSDLSTGVWGPGHGNVLQVPGTGDFYFLYLEYGEGGTTRQVFAGKLNFNADGSIQPVRADFNGIGYLGKNRQKKPGLALNATAVASSAKAAKTVTAQIETQPNLLTTFGSRFTGPNVKPAERGFTYTANNAVDTKNGTRWMAADDDPQPWLMLDLGAMKDIGDAEIFFVLPSFGHAWKLETSADGKIWTTRREQQELVVRSPQTIKKIGKARFLRITVLKGMPGIWELKIHPR